MSIKTTIVLVTTFVLGIVFTAFSVIVYQKAKAAYWGRLDAKLQGYATTVREEVDEQTNEHRFPTVADFKDLRSRGLAGSLLRILDSKGNVLVDDTLLDSQSSIAPDELVRRPMIVEHAVLRGERYRTLWTTIDQAQQGRYLLQIALPSTEVEASLQLLQLLLLAGVPIALIISAISVHIIVRGAFRPLAAFVHTVDAIGEKNLRERILLPRQKNEVRSLASTFNGMMDRIERAFASQRQFVADASHEIRTPLAIIRSELEFAQKQNNNESVRESIGTALEEVERLKSLSDNLLTLARIDSAAVVVEKTEVRLDELLADCIRKMKNVAEKKGVALVLQIDEVSTIPADREKLQRAILNIVDNALKYSYAGGTVTITTRVSDGQVDILVRDEGEGIPQEELAKIFERFHRTESQRSGAEGSGLGLAIVRGIVELHHGTLAVASEQGKGSVFTISLPLDGPT